MTEPEPPVGRARGEARAPGRNHYQRGRRLEWDARDALRAAGYEVFRTAGSKGCVDLIAFKADEVLLVQAKATGNLPSREWNAVVELAGLMPEIAVAVMVERDKGLKFWRLTARKTRRGIYPMIPLHIDFAA